MPGAVIAFDQARPGPSTSSGTPGVARKDLWQNREVTARSTAGGNSSYAWAFLDIPPGSAAALADASTANARFTPDLPGSYRVQLTTNGGGPGNVQILIAAVTFDVSGVQTQRGWRVPAYGETSAEDNFSGNMRGWAPDFEYMLADIRSVLVGSSGVNPALTVGPTGSGADYITDGTADEVQINAAITAANAGGVKGVVYILKGAYSIAAPITLLSDVVLCGAGPGATKIVVANAFDSANYFAIGSQGVETTGTAVNLTANVVQGDRVIPLTAGAEFTAIQPGDYLFLQSDAVWETTNQSLRERGEFVRVLSKGVADVTIRGMVRDSYATADTARVYRMTLVKDCGVLDLEISQQAALDSRSGSPPPMIAFQKSLRAFTSNVYIHDNDGPGLTVYQSLETRAVGLTIRDLTDNTPSNRLGYGILIGGASENTVVSGCRLCRVRHGIDSGPSRAPATATSNNGIPRATMCVDNVVSHATNAAYSTHSEAENFSFVGNVASNCDTFGFFMRGRSCRIVGNIIEWCSAGIGIGNSSYTVSGGSASGSHVLGNTIRHIKALTGLDPNLYTSGEGIILALTDNVTVAHNIVEACQKAGVRIRRGTLRCSVVDNQFLNCNLANASGSSSEAIVLDLNLNGSTASLSAFAGPDQVTLTGGSGFDVAVVGRNITISGAATGANNGTFPISEFVSATSIKYTNAAGVAPDANNGAITYQIEGSTDNVFANNFARNTAASGYDRDVTGHMKYLVRDYGTAVGNPRNVYRNNVGIGMETGLMLIGATTFFGAGNSPNESSPVKNVGTTPTDAAFLAVPEAGTLAIDTAAGRIYLRSATTNQWLNFLQNNASFTWLNSVASPRIDQGAVGSGNGQNMEIRAQASTAGGSTGGNLLLMAGSGITTNGTIRLGVAGSTGVSITPSNSAQSVYQVIKDATSVLFQHANNTTNSATAGPWTIQAANATGTSATGGDLNLTSGTGTTAPGKTRLQYGGTDALVVDNGFITVEVAEVVNSGTTTGETRTREDELTTADNTDHSLLSVSIPTDSELLLDVEVMAIENGAVGTRWWKKSMAFLNTGGAVTDGTPRDVDSETIGTPTSAWTVTLDSSGTSARVRVNGNNDDVRWYLLSQRARVVAA